MLMNGIKPIPIDELRAFTKWNDTFTRIAYNPETDVFIFQRTNKDGNVTCYEVVKPRLRDGIRCYPSSDDFGVFGFCFANSERDRARAFEFLKKGW